MARSRHHTTPRRSCCWTGVLCWWCIGSVVGCSVIILWAFCPRQLNWMLTLAFSQYLYQHPDIAQRCSSSSNHLRYSPKVSQYLSLPPRYYPLFQCMVLASASGQWQLERRQDYILTVCFLDNHVVWCQSLLIFPVLYLGQRLQLPTRESHQ